MSRGKNTVPQLDLMEDDHRHESHDPTALGDAEGEDRKGGFAQNRAPIDHRRRYSVDREHE